MVDAVALSRKGRARRSLKVEDPFLRPARATPGAANAIELRDEIVINEILYHPPPRHSRPGGPGQPPQPYEENDEQWIELFNRSASTVDLSGWQLTDDVEFRFTPGTELGPGEFLVVAPGAIEEIIAKHAQNQAGIPGMYEDIVELFSHRRGNAGAARLSLAHYNDIFLESQFENGADGFLYNMEGIRVLGTTHNRLPEGIKLGMPVDWVGDYDVMNLGDDPEQYRFSTTLRNNRSRNDHGPYIAMAKAFSLSGTALEQAIPRVIDVDQWMRYYAMLTLFEIGDTYTLGNPHNIGFYARPSDGRILALPYDWDFFFANGSSSPLWGNQNLAKVIARPMFTRLLHGHLHDLIQGVFTADYLGPYIANFGQVAGQSYSGYLARIRARAQYVRGRLRAAVPFEITSNGGADIAVTTPEVTLEGRGWIDVIDLRQAGGEPLALAWLDGLRWRAKIPLVATTQRLELEAFNRRGEKVGADGIGITTIQLDDVQRRSLRISEIHYPPSDVTDAEQAAGHAEDDFEFVEVANYGSTAVGLDGVRLEGAIRYAFGGLEASASALATGERVLVVKQRQAFGQRWGTSFRVVGVFEGSLNNAGEVIRLVDRQGVVIPAIHLRRSDLLKGNERFGLEPDGETGVDGERGCEIEFDGPAFDALAEGFSGLPSAPGDDADVLPKRPVEAELGESAKNELGGCVGSLSDEGRQGTDRAGFLIAQLRIDEGGQHASGDDGVEASGDLEFEVESAGDGNHFGGEIPVAREQP